MWSFMNSFFIFLTFLDFQKWSKINFFSSEANWMVTKYVTVGESELELFYHNSINYKILLHILYTGVEQPTLSLFPMNRDGQCSGKLKK